MKKLPSLLCILLLSAVFFTSHTLAQTSGDITLSHSFSSNHDSTQCRTDVTTVYDLTIANSFVNDSVRIYNPQGNTMFYAKNTSGASPWVLPAVVTYNQSVSDANVNNNQLNLNLYTPIYQVTCGPDVLTLNNGPAFSTTVPDPCAYGDINGKVYVDHNNDCSYTSGTDSLIPYFQYVRHRSFYQPGTSFYSSGATTTGVGSWKGKYIFSNLQNSYMDSTWVYIDTLNQFIYPLSPCNSTIYSLGSVPQSNLDFILNCGGIDVSARVGRLHPILLGSAFVLKPNVSNFGCDTYSDTLTLILDSRLTYLSSQSANPADYVNGDTLRWYYNNLYNATNGAYWNGFSGDIKIFPDTNTLSNGDTVLLTAYTGVPSNDVDSSNNIDSVYLMVLTSYDPNYKAVEPRGEGSAGFISDSVPKLTYTVHFQNTGSAPANRVHIVDTLDTNVVIPKSLRILDASHTMEPAWTKDNVIKFKFDPIYLPDSSANEPESHGFVTFEIDMKQGLAPGTEIKNKAEIYFDYNPPVITDYALNTIQFPEGIQESSPEDGMLRTTVYPNPMSDYCRIEVLSKNENADLTFRLMDLTGRVVVAKHPGDQSRIRINRGEFDSGVYLYEVTDNNSNQSSRGKLVVE